MKILVPTDFSNDAYNALFYAANLYKDEKCTFHILHATESIYKPKNVFPGGHERTVSEALSDGELNSLLMEIKHRIVLDTDHNTKHQFSTQFKRGQLTDSIEEFINLNPVDLVVMGNKGRKGAHEIFFGNNTLQVVKTLVSCPILCVPHDSEFTSPKQIGFLADYNHNIYSPELDHLKHLTDKYEAKLHVVHLCGDSPLDQKQLKNQKNLARILQLQDPHFHLVPFRRTKASAVKRFVKNQKLDILTMIYYRHYFINKLLREPLVLDLSFYLKIPLLIIPDKD